MNFLAAALILAACGRSSPPHPQEDPDHYHGREIAQTCSYLGADWLDRSDRAEREQPDQVVAALKLAPGARVADVGAGTGYFTVRLARAVGPTGTVYATDLQPEMLRLLDATLSREHIENTRIIRGTEHSAELPAACCDLVLLVDVYHELADPPGVMAGIRAALLPTGRLVLVEYRGEDPAVPIKPEHKMTLPRIKQELGDLGFAFRESLEFLPDQRIVVFTAADRTRHQSANPAASTP